MGQGIISIDVAKLLAVEISDSVGSVHKGII